MDETDGIRTIQEGLIIVMMIFVVAIFLLILFFAANGNTWLARLRIMRKLKTKWRFEYSFTDVNSLLDRCEGNRVYVDYNRCESHFTRDLIDRGLLVPTYPNLPKEATAYGQWYTVPDFLMKSVKSRQKKKQRKEIKNKSAE